MLLMATAANVGGGAVVLPERYDCSAILKSIARWLERSGAVLDTNQFKPPVFFRGKCGRTNEDQLSILARAVDDGLSGFGIGAYLDENLGFMKGFLDLLDTFSENVFVPPLVRKEIRAGNDVFMGHAAYEIGKGNYSPEPGDAQCRVTDFYAQLAKLREGFLESYEKCGNSSYPWPERADADAQVVATALLLEKRAEGEKSSEGAVIFSDDRRMAKALRRASAPVTQVGMDNLRGRFGVIYSPL